MKKDPFVVPSLSVFLGVQLQYRSLTDLFTVPRVVSIITWKITVESVGKLKCKIPRGETDCNIKS